MCPSDHWTWFFHVFHVSFSLTSKRKGRRRRGGGRRQKLRFTWMTPLSACQPLNYKYTVRLGSRAASKPPRPCSSHHMARPRQPWESWVWTHCGHRHGWLLTGLSRTRPVLHRLSAPISKQAVACYWWGHVPLEAPFQFSQPLRDQANWADDLSNKTVHEQQQTKLR